MKEIISAEIKAVLVLRWKPGKDLLVVLLSWLLVVGSLYTATVIVGPETGGGLPYFFIYAILTAILFGIGIPLGWMVIVRKRPLSDLGITRRHLWLSLGLQLVFSLVVIPGGMRDLEFLPINRMLPLMALALAIGFFEAIFWRGWMLMRLEEAFGFLPAAVIGSALYAAYHIGYAMPLNEMIFLFFIGLMYAAIFRITRSIFVLWPVFQPGGQLITLIRDGLQLPLIASVGFLEVLVVMWVLIWLCGRYFKRHRKPVHEIKPVTA